jgi:hypothetical protein
MRCKTCHYSLANLTLHRCPECGRAFDPRDRRTFEAEPVLITKALVVVGVLFIAVIPVASVGFTFLCYRDEPWEPQSMVLEAALVAVGPTVLLGMLLSLVYGALVLFRVYRYLRPRSG